MMNESKEHVKMFKSGKLWVSALVGTLFSTALIGANATDAHADDVNTAAPTQGTVQQGSTTTANNTVALSAASTNDVTAPVSTNTSDATSATSAVASQSVSASAAAPQSAASATSTAASTSATASQVTRQVKAQATSTAASTGKYADGTYPLDTSKAYKKSGTTETSTMQQYMGTKSSVTIKGNQASLTLATANTASADMINAFKINGISGVRQGNNFVFDLTVDQLDNILKGWVDVTFVLPGFDPINEKQNVDISLDMSGVLTTQQSVSASQSIADSTSAAASQSIADSIANSTSAAASQSIADSIANSTSAAASQSIADSIANSTSAAASQSIADSIANSTSAAASQSIADSIANSTSAAASQSIADSVRASISASQKQADETKKGAIADGTYETTTNYYKSGSTKPSSMNRFLSSKVKITVNGDKAQLVVSALAPSLSKIMPTFSIAGVEGFLNADGQSWTFTIPTSQLTQTLAGSVSLLVGPNKTENFDIDVNVADLPRVKTPESQTPDSQSQGSQSQESQSQGSQSQESQSQGSQSQESESTGSQSQEASQSGQAQKPESDVKPVQPTQPESGSQAPSVSEQSGSMTGATTPEVNGHASVSEAATSTPTASAVVSTQAKQNTPAAKTLPNTGSDQEAALTGLGVLIGTLGLGGILKKRH
ncbi:NEAT domain-containing protein [Weissella viridescens]|uniref:NEAT domain-containing protein n=1 Tax=Weissella viridescens TaxID=1629 RepID=UPI002577097D|nr:NEAT domain-containing protein [Weissella viridescens]WJI91552.1 KxYKxGKxW signal peptide domain-containing protein [Weissella viridescens]